MTRHQSRLRRGSPRRGCTVSFVNGLLWTVPWVVCSQHGSKGEPKADLVKPPWNTYPDAGLRDRPRGCRLGNFHRTQTTLPSSRGCVHVAQQRSNAQSQGGIFKLSHLAGSTGGRSLTLVQGVTSFCDSFGPLGATV